MSFKRYIGWPRLHKQPLKERSYLSMKQDILIQEFRDFQGQF